MARDKFLQALREAVDTGVLAKLTLGAPSGPDPTLRKVQARLVTLKAGPRLQLLFRHDTRDITKNLPHDEGIAKVDALLGPAFRSAHLYTPERSLQVNQRKRGWHLSSGPPQHTAVPSQRHDRSKSGPVALDQRWMDALKVSKGAKARQVRRFTEVLDHLLADAERPEDGRLRLVDLGCGRGALTFAAWQLLRERGYPHAEVVGVELRPALAAASEALARKLGCDGLTFVSGAIEETPIGAADVVIALHACDTATDDALAAGVTAQARWLMVAPCCHKEIRPQLSGPEVRSTVWRHGILRSREADLATDALRGAVLEASGYKTRIFEFVSTEHTDKNLMITGTRANTPDPAAAEQVTALAAFYGIEHQRLASLLEVPLR